VELCKVSPWNHSPGKRFFDLIFTTLLLVLISPFWLLVAMAVKLSSRGPVFFRQYRVGKDGRRFQLLKFRTMVHRPDCPGPGLTSRGDPRVTRAGVWLRKLKADELPQLLNVIRGDMAIVGPRPDLAEYLSQLTPSQSEILSLRPGITGAASLSYRNEEEVMGRTSVEQQKRLYLTEILPAKIRLDLNYARRASLKTDVILVVRTILAIVSGPTDPRVAPLKEQS
jgi:lipopolysaccharide/colanic/teichoic acid biosynthesis glycosyltransferase